MRKMIALVLLALALDAHAGNLTQMESLPGEGKHAFLLRVGAWMQRWTRQNEAEACATIARSGEAYGVVVQTQKQRDACLSDRIFAGWENTGENIHSHPPIRFGRGTMRRATGRFSDTDYLTPGYLVDGGTLFYQHGVGTEQVIGEIP